MSEEGRRAYKGGGLMNENLYVNAPVLVDLIECLQNTARTKGEYDMAEEILNLILDQPWKEIK